MKKVIYICFTVFAMFFIIGCSDEKSDNQDNQDNSDIILEDNFKVSDDENNIYLFLDKSNLGKHLQFYINTDGDIDTGYNVYPVNGADYVVEKNMLYKSTANSDKWKFEYSGSTKFTNNNNNIEITISKDAIGITQDDISIDIGIIGWDENYENKIAQLQMQPISLNGNIIEEGKLIISEVMAVNAHTKMDPDFFAFSDWIEIHNQSDSKIDISNYMLSDDLSKGKWKIPRNTTISKGEYLIFWADEENVVKNGYHTNFKLKNGGEAVALYSADGNLVDGFKFSKQQADVSYNKLGYMSPTPKAKNTSAIKRLSLSSKPVFSLGSGFYYQTQNVSLEAQNGAKIHYTTDGSFPDNSSAVYSEPFNIDKTTIIRARAGENSKLPSEVVTKSYFIDEETKLPVVSIVTNDDYFFDDKIGFYTIGTNGAPSPFCSKGPDIANYYRDWKRPANIEYFDKDKKVGFSLDADIKISGSCSRFIPQKSLSVKANSKYGKKSIDYKLFPNKNITEFKGFKLKSAGQDWYGTMLRDAFMQQVTRGHMDIDYQDYRPSVVYINGKYWGIHNIREKKNEDFLTENYPDLDSKKVDILQSNMFVNEGDNKDYKKMITYIKSNGLSNISNYNEVASRMDIENYIDYIIAETYFANGDWPYVNIRYYKEQKDGAKWRWIIEDLDLGLGAWRLQIETDMLSLMTATNNLTYLNPLWSTFLFRSLLENTNFKSRFKQRYSEHLNSTFDTDRVISILDNLTQNIRDEIPRHSARWRVESGDIFEDLNEWEINILHLKDIIRGRNGTVWRELESL